MVKNEKEDDKLKVELKNQSYRSSRFFSLVFSAVYIVAVTVFCIEYKIIPGPEFLVLGILIFSTYYERTWRAFRDWLPFITVFISYEVMYSFIGTISQYNLHSGPEILDQHIFGQILTITLQQTVRSPILDYMGAVFYGIYFFVPTIFAYFVWRKSPKNYWKYTVAFGVLTYSALITFLFYPVAPPWFQFNHAFNPSYSGTPVVRILTGSVDAQLHLPVYKTLFDFLSSNPFAAFPSMHSAMPWLVFLYAFKIWKWKSLPIAIIPVGTWFSAVYLGEHYFTDVVAGIAYATAAYLAVELLLPYLSRKIGVLARHCPPELSAAS